MRRRTFLKSTIGAFLAAPAWASQGARSYDAIVIGAGAIGCTTAYYLREEGLSVCLLDKGPVGREASWASAGMIQPSGSSKSESWPARATLLSRKLYDDLEPRLFEETGKRIGYGGDGGLIVAFDDADAAQLQAMVESQASDDFPPQLLNREDARTREPGLPDSVVAAAAPPRSPVSRCADLHGGDRGGGAQERRHGPRGDAGLRSDLVRKESRRSAFSAPRGSREASSSTPAARGPDSWTIGCRCGFGRCTDRSSRCKAPKKACATTSRNGAPGGTSRRAARIGYWWARRTRISGTRRK